jgi:ribonuclease BN (tRNA processing enzyme)
VGEVAAAAGVRRLVLTHAIFGAGGTPADVLTDVARAFPGPASVGEDLQTFVVGDQPW